MSKQLSFQLGNRHYKLQLEEHPEGVKLSGECDSEVLDPVSAKVETDGPWVAIQVNGTLHRMLTARDERGLWISWRGRSFYLESVHGRSGPAASPTPTSDEVRAPMTGTVIKVLVSEGDTVRAGDLVAVMEAMKMEYRLEAEVDGKVARVECQPGDLIDVGTLLVKMELADPS